MANNIDISQGELDKILSQMKPHVPSDREKIQAQVHEKFQGLVTQDRIDAMMSGKDSGKTGAADGGYYGAISQEELDRILKNSKTS